MKRCSELVKKHKETNGNVPLGWLIDHIKHCQICQSVWQEVKAENPIGGIILGKTN